MSGFSSRSEDSIERRLDVNATSDNLSEKELIIKYELNNCLSWIKNFCLDKVCLQFPDSLLCDSPSVSLWLEDKIKKSLYILGDTSYGSCCVDEVAAEHINCDGIIHFGHTCLSPTQRLPVLYILPKYQLNITKFITCIREHYIVVKSSVLLLVDVGYNHCIKSIQEELSDCDIIVAENITDKRHKTVCSKDCCLQNGGFLHSTVKLGRGYCINDDNINIVFIGEKDSRLMYNFRISSKGPFYCYHHDGIFEEISIGKSLQRRFYLMERLKDARTVGIIVGTLGVSGYLDAIKRISDLVRRKGKKCYVISVGKPTIAKLANFSEIEVYIMISCPEAVLENEKEFYQPILSVMEAEIALNEGRHWDGIFSSDFRDILPGGKHYVKIPDVDVSEEPDVSLVNNRIRYNAIDVEDIRSQPGDERTLQIRGDMTLECESNNLSNRSWRGLDPMLQQVPVTKAVQGRSGIPQEYSEEKQHSVS